MSPFSATEGHFQHFQHDDRVCLVSFVYAHKTISTPHTQKYHKIMHHTGFLEEGGERREWATLFAGRAHRQPRNTWLHGLGAVFCVNICENRAQTFVHLLNEDE